MTSRVEASGGPVLDIADVRDTAVGYPWNRAPPDTPPDAVDLRGWIDVPALDQGPVPACTAAVTTALASYWSARLARRPWAASVLFNYRMSRRLSGRPDRYGSTLADSFAAWREYGMVPDACWPFRPERVDVDPPPRVFASAVAAGDLRYGRIDGPRLAGDAYLGRVRACLSWGLPVSVEFPLGPSIVGSFGTGAIPVPPPDERPVARHVVLAVGYDDGRGALLVRNDWGERWGEAGHGWLPYEFLRRGIARHSWLVLG